MKPLTNKQKVRRVYPEAYSWHWSGGYFIYSLYRTRELGTSKFSARQAWANAAANLPKRRK